MSHTESIERLTLHTATAKGRLADLERSQGNLREPSGVTKAAIQELSTALEELEVANEQLQIHLEELAQMREDSGAARVARDELAHALPIAVVWTNERGMIEKANEAATELFDASERKLTGQPLGAFVAEEQVLFDTVCALCEKGTPVDTQVTVSAGTRPPRAMRLRGARLAHETLYLWFLHALPA
jgi:nitrogen fixation/metabolism regulation signal transduction histidine kinase